jgi:Spy/CpxP family protein refolding chaperone
MGHGRDGGWMGVLPRMTKELNLTDAQQAQIKSILQAERAKTQPMMQQLHKNEQAQNAAVNGNFDEAKAQAFAAGQAQLMQNLIVEKQRTKAQIYSVLTPEQRDKAQTLMQQREQRRQERMQKHQQQSSPTSQQ